ncbi:hypothetical protein EG68_00520 [Paragonimus skrjabini miyazakii]|uniref:Uncharacterized protein n=1 Tax=Paragonimus skrjabini miyazakii TaxID=59628 RepID=A0A8S9Z5M1_9TREM|nr:hypothetical protein EG68_00520 [Paragonimus skrjabini miyazakii]
MLPVRKTVKLVTSISHGYHPKGEAEIDQPFCVWPGNEQLFTIDPEGLEKEFSANSSHTNKVIIGTNRSLCLPG